jgi:SAM-dependent methyltransferase
MGLWTRNVFPRLMDLSMRGDQIGRLRAEALAEATGDVLEIGFGTALNLPHYPPAVGALTGLDPLGALANRVAARVARAPFPVRRVQRSADARLPFEAASFDTVVTTWTLCSIPDAVAALQEMHRVLRPGGRYLFLEHGLSDDPGTARWQHRLEPLHGRIAGGCRLTRRIDALVAAGGFEIDSMRRFCVAGGPRIFAEMYAGSARG